jgi:hypothetical protein
MNEDAQVRGHEGPVGEGSRLSYEEAERAAAAESASLSQVAAGGTDPTASRAPRRPDVVADTMPARDVNRRSPIWHRHPRVIVAVVSIAALAAVGASTGASRPAAVTSTTSRPMFYETAALGSPATWPVFSPLPDAVAEASVTPTSASAQRPTAPPGIDDPRDLAPGPHIGLPRHVEAATASARPAKPAATRRPTAATVTASSVSVGDRTGDLHDMVEGLPVGAPRYVDIRRLTVAAVGGDLTVRFDLAGPAPSGLDARHTTVSYHLLVDTSGDGAVDFMVDVSSADQWQVSVFEVAGASDHRMGAASVDGASVVARVPLVWLRSPARLRVQGLSQYTDFPDPQGDPLVSTTAQDRVPDQPARWLTVSTTG